MIGMNSVSIMVEKNKPPASKPLLPHEVSISENTLLVAVDPGKEEVVNMVFLPRTYFDGTISNSNVSSRDKKRRRRKKRKRKEREEKRGKRVAQEQLEQELNEQRRIDAAIERKRRRKKRLAAGYRKRRLGRLRRR
jgi:hypothetical protein